MNRNVNKYKGEKSTSWTNFIYKYQRKFLVRILQLLLFSSILTTGLNFLALLVGLASIVNFHVDLSHFIFEFTVMLFVSLVLFYLYKDGMQVIPLSDAIAKDDFLNIKNARYLQVLNRLFMALLIILLLYSIFIRKQGNLLCVIEFRSLFFPFLY